jgi:hypothetical protein
MTDAVTRLKATASMEKVTSAKADAVIRKSIKEIETFYKQNVKQAVDKAVKKGVDQKWAEEYFKEFLDEQLDMAEETLDDDAYGAQKRGKEFEPIAAQTTKAFLKDLKSCFSNSDAVLKDYERDVGDKNIHQVKKAGEKIASDPKQKVALLQKLGLNGAEFHAFCLMVKEQIK